MLPVIEPNFRRGYDVSRTPGWQSDGCSHMRDHHRSVGPLYSGPHQPSMQDQLTFVKAVEDMNRKAEW